MSKNEPRRKRAETYIKIKTLVLAIIKHLFITDGSMNKIFYQNIAGSYVPHRKIQAENVHAPSHMNVFPPISYFVGLSLKQVSPGC